MSEELALKISNYIKENPISVAKYAAIGAIVWTGYPFIVFSITYLPWFYCGYEVLNRVPYNTLLSIWSILKPTS